jgi:hypothetical protein
VSYAKHGSNLFHDYDGFGYFFDDLLGVFCVDEPFCYVLDDFSRFSQISYSSFLVEPMLDKSNFFSQNL